MIVTRSTRAVFLSLAIASTLAASPVWADSAALLGAARADIAAGDASKAFESLYAAEGQYAGEVEFDYWLGFAANRAGQSGRALFALERVLAQNPNHAAARLELALAFARLNLGDAARTELDVLESQNPPPAAQAQIAELRRQLGLGDQARRLEKRVAFVSLEAGFDDNVGSYPKDFGLPGLPGPEEISSPYWTLTAGVRQRVDLKANQRLTFSLNGLLRRHTDDGDNPPNDDATQFDQDFIGGRAEWSRDMDGRREFALAADAGYLRLDGESYYDYIGADAEWRQQRDDRTRTVFTVGVRNMQFEADQYDNLMSRVRGGVRHQLNRSWRLEGDVSMEYEAAANDRPGGDAIRASLRGVAGWQFRPDQRLSGDLTFTRTEYTKEYGLPFNDSRSDDRWLVGAQWEKTFQQLWQLRARVQYRDQDSTLTTYTFDQTSGSVSLTRYF